MKTKTLDKDTTHIRLKRVCALLLVGIGMYASLHVPAFTELAANRLAASSFYLPRMRRADTHLAERKTLLLSEAFFGAEYHELDEEIVILHDNSQAPSTSLEGSESPSEASNEPPTPTEDTDGMLPIIACDLGTDDILTLNDTTKKRPNTASLLISNYDYGYDPASEEPLVLILHTHATECYSREGSELYDPSSSTRSNDAQTNMLAVGEAMCASLEKEGIRTLHCKEMHDAVSYRDSYSLAAESIRKYIQDHPSIKYVFDIHRDAVMYDSGAKARAVTLVDGKEAAQIMLLVGSDAGGADFPHWERNLTLALKLADAAVSEYPSLMRPIALRGASYNEQYTDGSLLIEIGTDGNTLSQAKYSATLLGGVLAKLIKSN